MSDERPAGQDEPPVRPSLGAVAAWLQATAQPAPVDDAAPAGEDAPAHGGGEGERPAGETATSGHADATAFGEASGTGPGALPDDETPLREDEAPPVGDETDAGDHGPAEVGGTGSSSGRAPAVEPDSAEGPATGPSADRGDDLSGVWAESANDPRDDTSPASAEPNRGEGADLLPNGSAVADPEAGAVSSQETPTDPWSWADDGDDDIPAGAGEPSPPEVPSPDPASALLPPAEAASVDPPVAEEAEPVEERRPEERHPEELQADDGGGRGSSDTSTEPIGAALPDEPSDGPHETAAGAAPAPPVPTAIWSTESAPETTDDRSPVPLAEGPTSADEDGSGAPDAGAATVEATAASAAAPVWAGGEEPADDPESAAALFELDLAKLAERARASALREAAPAPQRSFEPPPEHGPVEAPDLILEPFPRGDPSPAPDPLPPPPPFPGLLPASESLPPAPALDPISAPSPEPFQEPAPAPADGPPGQTLAPEPPALVSDEPTRAFDLSWDEEDDEPETPEVAAATGGSQGEVARPVRAASPTRRPKRPRYPRGQLREPIGVLRRIRAMLGILVVTVLLGVAAGAAVGAFIFFLAFAVRNAITSQ